jgi:hypothetical protein
MDSKNEPTVLSSSVDGGNGDGNGGSLNSTRGLTSSQPPEIVTVDEEHEPVAVAVSVEAVPIVDVEAAAAPHQQHHQQQDGKKKHREYHLNEYDDANDGGCDCMLCGDTTIRRLRSGGTMINCFMSLCGNTYMDLRDTITSQTSSMSEPPASESPQQQPQQQQQVYNIIMIRLCGDTRIIVPPGTIVRARRIMLCGNRDIHIEPCDNDVDNVESPAAAQQRPPPAKLTVNILMLCGNLIVRSDDRDF